MNARQITRRIKPWVLPAAMLAGALAHNVMEALAPLAPWLIFAMLFITFCRVNPRHLRFTRLTPALLAVQMLGAIALWVVLRPLSADVAQATFMCVFCPTATAAPVVTGMLGGSVECVATFSIASNLAVAATAPFLLTVIGAEGIDPWIAVQTTAMKVMPLIIAPLAAAVVLQALWPRAHAQVARRQSWSFAIWAVSLFIVVGRAISFIMAEPADRIGEMVAIALASGVACALQFRIGRVIGRRLGQPVAGTQALGQKNTVLAIWMTLTWLNPIASVGPAAYVAWQNSLNSWQLYRHGKKEHPTV